MSVRFRDGLRYTEALVSHPNDEILDIFRQSGGYLEGHFRLTSGLHSPEYLQCALVLQHPGHAEDLGRRLAVRFRTMEPHRQITAVVSPAMGGLIIGHEVARGLGVRHIFTERVEGKMALRRGFSLSASDTIVVVEDVITTGGSTVEVIQLARSLGAGVVAAGSVIDRSGGRADVGVPRVALATLNVITWAAEECPLCRQGSPAVKPGSRPSA